MTAAGSRAWAHPNLSGGGWWLNTGGRSYSIADLRGIQEKYADLLVIVGVHSPSFAREANHDAVAAAVERSDVGYPVLDDPDLTTRVDCAVPGWPMLALLAPGGT